MNTTILQLVGPDIVKQIGGIRLLLSDVDGVLTDGGVYYDAEGEAMKRFNIRDGMGVERLRDAGIEVGLVTGEESKSVVRRAEKLGITRVHLLAKNKAAVIDEIIRESGIPAEEIGYIGDDVNDLEAMKLVGFSAAPADALARVREAAHYVCSATGGNGAFREVAEIILETRDVPDTPRSIGFR